jgi:hypothetical protein
MGFDVFYAAISRWRRPDISLQSLGQAALLHLRQARRMGGAKAIPINSNLQRDGFREQLNRSYALPLGTIWSKRSDAASLESVSAAQPPAEAGPEHRRTAQKAIGKAADPLRPGHAVRLLRSWKPVFPAIRALPESFQSDRPARCGRDNTRFVIYLASLFDLCVTFRISSPQFRECDNASASKLGVNFLNFSMVKMERHFHAIIDRLAKPLEGPLHTLFL